MTWGKEEVNWSMEFPWYIILRFSFFAYNLQILINIPTTTFTKKEKRKKHTFAKQNSTLKPDFNYQRLSFSSKPLIIVCEWVRPQNQNQNQKSVWIFIWGLCVCVGERDRVFKWEWNEQPQVPSLWLRSCVSEKVSKVTK